MKQPLGLLFAIILLSCNSTNKTHNIPSQTDLKTETNQTVQLNFNDFKILAGQLGKIKIGMTIAEAEMQFSGLTKKVDEAINFGFGGGSPAYLYYWADELVFGLIPKLETDTLLFIVAANKNLQTTNGLNPKSTVKEILKEYPKLTVQQDLMNDFEFFQDETNRWDFIFKTSETTKIGEYPKSEFPSKPKRLTTKADWITIR